MATKDSSLENLVDMSNLGYVDIHFWNKKRVFLTGHTGFKGSWLSLWLQEMGAIVKGYSLSPNTNINLFSEALVEKGMESEIGDIRNLVVLSKSIQDFNPEILIHMAAQPLVRRSYHEPIETYSTNVMGTLNVLEAARICTNLKSIVVITTDKCYENKEWPWGYRENEAIGGHDLYSSSKACCELLIASYRKSFFCDNNSPSLASARAGNVIGGGDWSEDRLIPDILKSFEKSEPVIIRNPNSIRPWQHVLEPLSGYLVLAQRLYIYGSEFSEAWNFGPRNEDCQPVKKILDIMMSLWGNGVSWKLDIDKNLHEAGILKLDCSKAAQKLNWQPKWDLNYALRSIINWHKNWLEGGNVRQQCIKEIQDYSRCY